MSPETGAAKGPSARDFDATPTRILLVEDNPADADLVCEYLEESEQGAFDVTHATRLDEAVASLSTTSFEVVLLDLRLPDGEGTASVRAVREVAHVPIVVLTGTDDEELALRCIDAGADDYLRKREIEPRTLRRAIGFAISRRREAQIRELSGTLARYRQLSDPTTSVTAGPSGVGPLRERFPDEYESLVQQYTELLDEYLEQLVLEKAKPREGMDRLVTRVGDAAGDPRDLLHLHVDALEVASEGEGTERGRALAVEGRLLALEMMGLLVDYYRTGARRSGAGGSGS